MCLKLKREPWTEKIDSEVVSMWCNYLMFSWLLDLWLLLYSPIHPSTTHKYLLNMYYMSDTFISAEDILVNQTDKNSSFCGVCMHACMCVQSCLILWDSTDCSPPGSSVHGILLARVLEWVAVSYSRGSSWPRDQTWVSYVSCIGRQVLYQ